ncbi:hypothetical protein [Congregicoccus parvus]
MPIALTPHRAEISGHTFRQDEAALLESLLAESTEANPATKAHHPFT